MTDRISIAADLPDHRKTRALVAACGEGSIRCLLRLWVYAARRRPLGILDRMSVADVEAEARWEGEAGAFVEALRKAGFIETDAAGTLILHDWAHYQKELEAMAPGAALAAKKWTKYRKTQEEAALYGSLFHRSTPQETAGHRTATASLTPALPPAVARPCSSGPPAQAMRIGCADCAQTTAVNCSSVSTAVKKQLQLTAVGAQARVKAVLLRLGWTVAEADAVAVDVPDEAHVSDPAVVWPVAKAIYATQRVQRNRVAYVWGSKHEPQDWAQRQARVELAGVAE